MRRIVAILTVYVFLFGVLQASSAGDPPKHKSFLRHLFGPRGIIFAAISSSIQHARNAPAEWGSGLAGLSRRYASAFGQHLVNGTVQYSVAKALHEDLKYYPSEEAGFKPRVKHALISTVYARKTNGEGQTLATSRFSGAVAGGFVSRAWQPARFHTFGSGISSAGISLAVDAGLNVLREFWPEIRHPRRRLNEARAQLYGSEPPCVSMRSVCFDGVRVLTHGGSNALLANSFLNEETRTEIEVVELDAEECLECAPANPSY
jgi:hypothetical protein